MNQFTWKFSPKINELLQQEADNDRDSAFDYRKRIRSHIDNQKFEKILFGLTIQIHLSLQTRHSVITLENCLFDSYFLEEEDIKIPLSTLIEQEFNKIELGKIRSIFESHPSFVQYIDNYMEFVGFMNQTEEYFKNLQKKYI